MCYVLLAFWLCPQLRISARVLRWVRVREVLTFGGKTVLQGVARSGLYQISGLIVAYFLGAGVLAVYARQRALIMVGNRLLNQYGNVFTPSSSALAALLHD